MTPSSPQAARLADIVDVVGGGTPSKKVSAYWQGDIPWVSPKDMKRWELFDAIDHISQEAVDESACKLVRPPAVLLVVRGMILIHSVPVAISRVPLAINQDMKALVPRAGIDADYLAIMLAGASHDLLARVEIAGHGTRRLPTDAWESLRVRVPELGEQRRTVACVNEMMDRVRNIEAERRIATAARDALLPAALEDLFRPLGRRERPLSELLTDEPQNGLYLPKSQYEKSPVDSIPMVHMGDMFRRFALDAEIPRRVRASAKLRDKYGLRQGDVLVARRSLVFEGSGSMTEVPALVEPTLFESSIIRIRPIEDLLPGFLVAYFFSRSGTERRLDVTHRATISGINQAGLLRLRVPVPPVAAQRQVVEAVRSVRRLVGRLQDEDSTRETTALRASILRKAFAGAV